MWRRVLFRSVYTHADTPVRFIPFNSAGTLKKACPSPVASEAEAEPTGSSTIVGLLNLPVLFILRSRPTALSPPVAEITGLSPVAAFASVSSFTAEAVAVTFRSSFTLESSIEVVT